MKSIRPYRVAAMAILCHSFVTLPAHAQDICSPEGKSKMRAASVSEIQITKICSVATAQPGSPTVDYRDLQSVILDAQNAKGKTIQLNGRFRGLTMAQGRPAMSFWPDTSTSLDVWTVVFSSNFNSALSELQTDKRLSITCRITELSNLVSECNLIKLSIH